METEIKFKSGNLTLAGTVHSPGELKSGERQPAMLVLHGFGTKKESGTTKGAAALFAELGYITSDLISAVAEAVKGNVVTSSATTRSKTPAMRLPTWRRAATSIRSGSTL